MPEEMRGDREALAGEQTVRLWAPMADALSQTRWTAVSEREVRWWSFGVNGEEVRGEAVLGAVEWNVGGCVDMVGLGVWSLGCGRFRTRSAQFGTVR